jgi:uncharacterized protein YjiS (DUF1127 family)
MNSQAYPHPISTLRSQPSLIEKVILQPGILLSWYRRAQSRFALSQLDQRLLDDIGVSAEAAELEINKPFWKD